MANGEGSPAKVEVRQRDVLIGTLVSLDWSSVFSCSGFRKKGHEDPFSK
jgi:hypothetical protein